MTKSELTNFIGRILADCTPWQAGMTMRQLCDTLKLQNAPKELIELAEQGMSASAELKDIADQKRNLDEKDFPVAVERMRNRVLREEAARSYGRC